MPLEAPPPRPFVPGGSEQGHVIQAGIARELPSIPFDLCKDRFEFDDGVGAPVGGEAQAGVDQVLGEAALPGIHLLERQPGPVAGDVVPVLPFLILEIQHRLDALIGGEGCEQRSRGVGHAPRRLCPHQAVFGCQDIPRFFDWSVGVLVLKSSSRSIVATSSPGIATAMRRKSSGALSGL